MSESDALFSAILADPTDDLPRLVYADWLEETARPVAVARARFIRLQIELACGIPAEHFPERTSTITDELEAIATRWSRAWLAELPTPVANAIWKQRLGTRAFRRGFVDGVTLEATLFRQHASELLAAAPITTLHLHGGYADTTFLLMCPNFRRLQIVRLSGGWDGDRIARRLAKCPDLGAIRELDLAGCDLTDTGALDLGGASALGKLSFLCVRHNRLTGFGVGVLVSAPALAAITQLDVTGNPGVRWLTTSTRARYGRRLLC